MSAYLEIPPSVPFGQCSHEQVTVGPSPHAEAVGFHRPERQQRATAAGLRKGQFLKETAFPGPLVLPNDDLAWDPKWPPQSLRSWRIDRDRNALKPERRTIYIAASPAVGSAVKHIKNWRNPCMVKGSQKKKTPPPNAQDVVDYLATFYHGMSVKLLPRSQSSLLYTSWEDAPRQPKGKQQSIEHTEIALATTTEAIRIRSRPCPDGAFAYQVNLNDLLDVVVSILPEDAYSLLLLIEQDMYEDEDDDYCCGRAYGGSRCAVVSTARYDPLLPGYTDTTWDENHVWPASHCDEYVNNSRKGHEGRSHKTGVNKSTAEPEVIDLTSSPLPSTAVLGREDLSPLGAAIRASMITPGNPPASTWLASICRTASHELGHCLGIDHCVYYACIMQGTSSMAEDRRQPPYLCPIDLEKVRSAICCNGEDREVWTKNRYAALLSFCEARREKGDGGIWAGFAGWLKAVLTEPVDVE